MSEPGKRLFAGIRVSVATANALAGAAETLARRARDSGVDIRWVAPVSYHLTLKFLGWTREAAIGAIVDGLEAAAETTPRFTIRCTRLGGRVGRHRGAVGRARRAREADRDRGRAARLRARGACISSARDDWKAPRN